MPDITMCGGSYLEKCKSCYRVLAKPNPHRQSYFTDPPVTVYNKCEQYIPMEITNASKKDSGNE